jgi:hypothetical protein
MFKVKFEKMVKVFFLKSFSHKLKGVHGISCCLSFLIAQEGVQAFKVVRSDLFPILSPPTYSGLSAPSRDAVVAAAAASPFPGSLPSQAASTGPLPHYPYDVPSPWTSHYAHGATALSPHPSIGLGASSSPNGQFGVSARRSSLSSVGEFKIPFV